MTTLTVTDENTGKLVTVDIDSPSGNLYVRDANTGEFVLLDLSSPAGTIKITDAKTGEFVEVDYNSPTGTVNVIDQNTGEFLEISLSTPSGILYCLDDNTGELVEVNLSTASFFKVGNFIKVGESDTTQPTCTITCAQTSPTAVTPLQFTITFSEPVTGFVIGDFIVGNGAKSNFAGSGAVYTCDVTPTAAGNVTADVAAGVAIDAAGNENTAATQLVIESRLYLLDQFVTSASAPLTTPRTAEPGPGTMAIVDASNKLSIAGGKLVGAGGAVSGIWGGAFTRAQGLALIVDFTKTVAAATEAHIGWDTNQSGALAGNAFYFNNTTAYYIDNNVIQGTNRTATLQNSVNYKLALILRTAGMYYCIKGGAFTEWTLLQPGHLNSTASLYPAIYIVFNMAFESDFMRVVQLGAPFSTDKAIATNNITSPTVGEETTSTADGVVEMVWQAVTGETWNLMVRRTDNANCWAVRCSQGGSTVKLIEINGGVETERASAAQSFTNGTSYKLIVEMVGNSIRTTIGTITGNQTAMNTYNSASFNSTATGVKTDRAGTNLICWPRTLSGTAVTVLNNAVNPT